MAQVTPQSTARPARPRQRSAVALLAGVGLGALAGAAWGALARIWMRTAATGTPEFSWAGTLVIVALFTTAGAATGAVVVARRRGWRGPGMVILRLVGMASTLVLSLGQGALMLPTLVLGGLALARRSWPVPVRAGLGALALAGYGVVMASTLAGWPHSALQFGVAIGLGLLVYAGAAVALAQSYAPAPGGAIPRSFLWGLLALPLPLALAVGLPTAAAAALGVVVVAAALAAAFAVRSGRRRRVA